MLFGLDEYHGCTIINILDEKPTEDGHQAVEALLLDGSVTRMKVLPENIGKRASAENTAAVLSSDDLVLHILQARWAALKHELRSTKPPNLSFFARAAAINKVFASTAASDLLWKRICMDWWSFKWGYDSRMARGAGPKGWRARYHDEQIDSKRTSITPAELHSLRFDFRFWFMPAQQELEAGPIVFDSALEHSITRRVRLRGWTDHAAMCAATSQVWTDPFAPGGSTGRVFGHPNGDEPTIVWILDSDGRGIQWGYPSHLWPKGEVRRTPSWGWEICNRNVVLRAIHDGDNEELQSDDEDDEADPRVQRAMRMARSVMDQDLWGDLIDSLAYAHVEMSELPGGSAVMRLPARGIPGLNVSPGLIY